MGENGCRDRSCTGQARLMRPGRALARPAFIKNGWTRTVMLRHLPGANRPCKLLHHKPMGKCVQRARTRGGLPGPSRHRLSCFRCLWRAVLCCQPGPRSMKCLFGATGGIACLPPSHLVEMNGRTNPRLPACLSMGLGGHSWHDVSGGRGRSQPAFARRLTPCLE